MPACTGAGGRHPTEALAVQVEEQLAAAPPGSLEACCGTYRAQRDINKQNRKGTSKYSTVSTCYMPVNTEPLDNALSSENQAPNGRLSLCLDATTVVLLDEAASKTLPAACTLIARWPSVCVLAADQTVPRHGLFCGWGNWPGNLLISPAGEQDMRMQGLRLLASW